MGYDDEVDRSRRRQSRSRQPVKRPGVREPEYRKSREPELNLITDTFRDDDYRKSRSKINTDYESGRGARSRKQKKPSKGNKDRHMAGRQSAAARQEDSGVYRTPAKKKAQRRKQKLLIILVEVIILMSVMAFAAYSYLDHKISMVQRLPWDRDTIKNVEISEEKQEQMKGYWTIAIFGVDSRNSSVGKGNNADVNLICNINQDTGEIKLVSVYRDTYLNIKENSSYNKINAAYLQGGPEQAVKALNRNLDLDIDDYAVFNWKAVADAINILDGIDIELSESEFYYMNAFVTETAKSTGIPTEPVKHAGLVHMDGVQAVAYGRLRLMDTDYARTERQRKVIALAFEKAKKADWATLNNVVQTVFPQVATSVELMDILGMGRDIGKLHLGETEGFPAARGETNMGKKGACVIPQTLESNVKELHKFLFGDVDYTPTNTVKTISQKIISDTGLAKEKKPAGPAKTDGGSVPGTESGKDNETRGSAAARSESHTKESDESSSSAQESGSVKWEQWETDSHGNWVAPTKESQSESGPVRPGTNAGTGAYETSRPEQSGTASLEGNTDTGVIIGPGESASGGGYGTSGYNQNAPGNQTGSGSGSSGYNPNAPGSQTGNGSGSGGYNQNAPGSQTGNGSGQTSPSVEFIGPMGP